MTRVVREMAVRAFCEKRDPKGRGAGEKGGLQAQQCLFAGAEGRRGG